MKKKKFKKTKSAIVHKNPWWRVRKDDFEFPDGKKGKYYIVDIKGGSFVIPVKDGKIIFARQYRYPIDRYTLELPNGCIKEGYSALKAAQEELIEEVGYKANKIKKIGTFSTSTGVSSEVCHVYLAEEIELVGEEPEDVEVGFEMESVEIGVKKAYKMLDNGEIFCGQTMAALALARKHLIK